MRVGICRGIGLLIGSIFIICTEKKRRTVKIMSELSSSLDCNSLRLVRTSKL